jgi:Phospholipase_D-nuclease N-terminal
MLGWFSSRGVSAPIAIAIIALGVMQLALQIWALVDLIKRPAPTQRKGIFAAVIVLGGLVGAIAYLAVGRSMLDAEARSEARQRAGEAGNDAARQRALDQLYGSDHRK